MAGNTIALRNYEPAIRQYALERFGQLFLNWLKAPVMKARDGLVYAHVITGATAAGATEGTLLGGSGTSTTVALTGDTLHATPISVEPHQSNALDFTDPGNMVAWAETGVGTLLTALQNSVIAALKAASLTNTGALPASKQRFLATSAADQLANENVLMTVRSRIMAHGYLPGEIAMVWPAQAYNNFLSGRTFLHNANVNLINTVDQSGLMPMFNGSPMFIIPEDDAVTGGATDFGGVTNSEQQLFLIGNKGYALHFDGPYVTRTPGEMRDDGFEQLRFTMPFWQAVRVAGHLGQVTNQTS